MINNTLLILLMLFCSCKQAEVQQITDGSGEVINEFDSDDWKVTVISDELVYPWEIRRSGSTLVITETEGNIVMVSSDGTLRRYPVQTSSPVSHIGGSGLMGLALAADFASSGTAYAYHTYSSNGGYTNRIIQLHFNGSSWRESRVLLDGIPGHNVYNGGRLAIGPDGLLYAATGWTANLSVPQDLNNLAGKILRLNLNGEPAAGNPFAGSYVYSYGHRNPQGLAWNANGQLYVAEHGQSARDEINRISPGGNYGWPLIQGDQQQAGMITPYFHTGNSTLAPSGIAFTARGELVVAALAARAIYVVNESTGSFREIFSINERMRAVLPHENGMYLITTNTSPQQASGTSGIADRLLWIEPK
jgi:glucose/arabinose dehydrogenase